MNQTPVRLGPLALLLTVISICVTTLSVLVYTTARADAALAEKYAETVKIRYALEEEGQRYLCDLERGTVTAADPDGTAAVTRTFEKDGTRLHIAMEPDGDRMKVTSWRFEKEWTEDTDIGNLWDGR